MRYSKISASAFITIILALCLPPAEAQITVQKSAFGIGGTVVSSDSFKVSGTAGQLFIGKAENSTYVSHAGLWYLNRIMLGLDDFNLALPAQFELFQNYPNPFNPVTRIKFSLPKAGQVKILIYNMLGQQVAVVWDNFKPAGYHTLDFDAGSLASGMYFYRLQAQHYIAVRQMLLLK